MEWIWHNMLKKTTDAGVTLWRSLDDLFYWIATDFFFHLKYWRVVNIAFDFICRIQYFRVPTLIRREMIDVFLFFNIRYFFLKRTAYNRQHFMFYTFIMADLYNMEATKEFYSPLQSVLVYNIFLSNQVHGYLVYRVVYSFAFYHILIGHYNHELPWNFQSWAELNFWTWHTLYTTW